MDFSGYLQAETLEETAKNFNARLTVQISVKRVA